MENVIKGQIWTKRIICVYWNVTTNPQFVLLTYSNKNKSAKNKSKLDKNVITKKVKNKGEELQLKGMMEVYL